MANIPQIQSEHVWVMFDGAVVGAIGGMVNSMRSKSIHDWGQTLATVATAGFTGMLAQLVASWLEADLRLQFAISGIAGYSGGILLDDIVRRFRKIINAAAETLEDVGKSRLGAHERVENKVGAKARAGSKKEENTADF